MLWLVKNFKLFSTKSTLQLASYIGSSMSTNTRTLRSRTTVKVKTEISNNTKAENVENTSKYFQKKINKKETGVSKNAEKSVKNAGTMKSKPKKLGSKVLAKQQEQTVVIKAECTVPDIVITEASNENLASNSTDNSNTTINQEAVVNKLYSKKGKIGKKGKVEKDVIETKQISPKAVKTEVLSDDDFTSIPTKDDAKLELGKDSKNKISPKKKKQVQKPLVKAEPQETKTEQLSDHGSSLVSPRKRKQAQKTEKATKLKTEDIEDWAPDKWEVVLDNILEMRKWQSAPVDMMGCEECPEKDIPPEIFRYQTLISVMLSSQTRDEVTYAATQRLIAHGLTVDSILATPDDKIGELIYPAGFWKSKIKFIKNTTRILKDQYNGDIPRTFKDLCKLPGVGPKMANIVMSVGWKDTVGIAVDTHVHRISNRLGWVPKPTKEPEQTRKALESWLPREHWDPINITLVGFGQTICRPVGPSCHTCLNAQLCPFGRTALKEGLLKKSPKK